MKAMNRCVDEKHYWPDSLAEVWPEKIDEFLSHTDVCPYHAHRLSCEDLEFRSPFRPARGLNPNGEILEDQELEAAKCDHARRQAHWQGEKEKKSMPFTHLALRNAGREIACCGEFFEFQKHQASHWLDPEAGLQVFGVLGGGADDETLLGFFPLIGVRLDGKEHRLELDNGYTVGLLVEKLNARTFAVQFRCVENEELAEPGNEPVKKPGDENRPTAVAAAAGGSSGVISGQVSRDGLPALPQVPAALLTSRVWYVNQFMSVFVSCVVCTVFWLICNPWAKSVSKTTLPSTQSENSLGQRQQTQDQTPPEAGTNSTSSAVAQRGSGVTSNKGNNLIERPADVKKTRGAHAKKPSPTPIPQTEQLEAKGASTKPASPSHPDDYEEKGSPGAHESKTWSFRAFVDSSVSPRFVILNVGTDARLGGQLWAQMQTTPQFFTGDSRDFTLPQMTIAWKLTPLGKSATVEASLIVGGENKHIYGTAHGNYPEQSSEEALKKTIQQVYEIVRNLEKAGVACEASQSTTGTCAVSSLGFRQLNIWPEGEETLALWRP